MIRIGVLGTANIATKSVIPALMTLREHFCTVGISSRSTVKAKEVATNFAINPFDGYDSILSKKIVDAIYIPLPNALHYRWVKTALNRGIHVLVEKSLACTYAEVEELCELASKRKVALVENFQFRFHRQLKEIQNMVNSGKIGELRAVKSYFGFPPFADLKNIRYQNALGGGALLDAGVYPLKIAQIFLGLDLTVGAANLNSQNDSEVDIWGGAYLKQRTGHLFAEVAFGFDNYYQCNLELWGSKGKIVADRIFTAPPDYESVIKLYTSNGREEFRVGTDNHFINMLTYLSKVICDEGLMEKERIENLSQAKLIAELKEIAV